MWCMRRAPVVKEQAAHKLAHKAGRQPISNWQDTTVPGHCNSKEEKQTCLRTFHIDALRRDVEHLLAGAVITLGALAVSHGELFKSSSFTTTKKKPTKLTSPRSHSNGLKLLPKSYTTIKAEVFN